MDPEAALTSPPSAAPAVPPPARRAVVRLALFGAVAVLSIAFGFIATPAETAGEQVRRFGYWAMTVTFGWFVVAFARVAPGLWRGLPPAAPREHWQAGGLIAACTLVAALTVPYGPKVFYDELVLQATAWDLHHFREVGTVVRAYEFKGVFLPVQTYLDKRPFFFAYVVSLLHDLTGYRLANVFALNTVLFPAVLGLFYLHARRLAARAAALAALLALGTFSLLAHNATGAGMELLNLAMILLVLHLAAHWLAAPGEDRLTALVLAVVLLAQTRYESALYVVPAALVVLEGWRRAGRLVLPAAAVLGPALLVPCALHNTYLSGTPMLWELREREAARFGLQYLANNLGHAWSYFTDTSGMQTTSSWWLFAAGLTALAALLPGALRALPRWRAASPAALALALVGAAMAGTLLLLQFYYWGQLDDPIVARLCLPFAVLLMFCLALALDRWSAPGRPLAAWAATGAVLGALTTGLVANARHTGLNLLAQELAWEDRVVAARPPATRLIITNKSALPWLLRRICAIQLHERAGPRAAEVKFHLDGHTFGEALVFQTWLPVGPEGGFQLDPKDHLPDSYVIETVAERRFGGHLDRISRVVAINLPAVSPAEPPLEPSKENHLPPPAASGDAPPSVRLPAVPLARNL